MNNLNVIVDFFFYFSLGFVALLMTVYFFYFWWKKKPFQTYSLNVQIKNILNVALLSATSVAVIFIFSQFSSIMVVPMVRVAFEGILVKIAGFLFGPVIGIISALITELAVLAFVPTYFHYKFLLVLISTGAFSGLIKVFFTSKLKKKWLLVLVYTGLLFSLGLTAFFFYASLIYFDAPNSWAGIQFWLQFKNRYLLNFSFESIMFYGNLLAFFLLFSLIIVATFWLNWKGKRSKWISNTTLLHLLPIMVLTIFSEYFISVFTATSANQSIFGGHAQGGFILFTSAIFLAPFKIIINTFIVYQVWNAFRFHLKTKSAF